MKQVPLKTWKKFLKSQGLVHVNTEGSHEKWDRPDDSLSRLVIFRTTKKEIPIKHIATNLQTLDISLQEFKDMI